jgi:D-serine deaminase-like pyridoxal phosphate-dependent protein
MVKGTALVVTRLSEEHGVIEDERVTFGLGDKLEIIPNHACSVVNLFDSAWLRDTDGTVRKAPVDARGRLT